MNYFGTDGIRGRFGVFPITPDFLLRLGFAAGAVLKESSNYRPSVLIGKDTRLSGYVIEAALQAGFNASGVDVHMLGVVPTPAIAHLTKSFHADLGVVISASHNSFTDNGVKFFAKDGKKIGDDFQSAIREKLTQVLDADDGQSTDGGNLVGNATDLGKNHRIDDAIGRYVEFCKGTFPYHNSLRQFVMVLDCANGAAYKIAPMVFRELGAQVIVLSDMPDGTNINLECGSTHPDRLQEAVLAHSADFGIALDGDGDRIVMADRYGRIVEGDQIVYMLAMHGKTRPIGVVGTQMSSMALELAMRQAGIDFYRSKVGDRYVMQALCERGWQLGGEPSGHILLLDKAGTGDAIVAGLQVLEIMVRKNLALHELLSDYQPMPQTLVNVRFASDKLTAKQKDPYANPSLAKHFSQVEQDLAGKGRLVIRPSGTEPVIRVLVESYDRLEAARIADELALLIKENLS